jgi:hypothetical protein
MVYIDNEPAHNSKFFRAQPAEEAPVSTLSLFGKVKSALIGRDILNEIELLEALTETLNDTPDAELQRLSQS